ncbi:hypothetical protein OAT11_05405 [Nitrospinaceae bacterium]|nr:hypothetical protein [Nitrospinaceae bacterium]
MFAIKTIVQRHHVWITFFFTYVLLASIAIYKGSAQSPDTGSYIILADRLISHQFNLFSYYRDDTSVHHLLFYTLPISILAILKLIMDDQWIAGYLITNLIALFFTLFLYIKIALNLGIRKWLVSASLLVFWVSTDFLVWPRYILTDTLFASMVMLVIYVVTTRTSNYYSSYIFIIISLFFLLITRPSSLPYIAVFLFFVFMPSMSQKILVKKTLFVRLGCFILLSSFFYSIIIMANTSGIIESATIDIWYTWIAEGAIIHDRPETYIVYEATHLGTMKLFIYRMVGFFTPFLKNFSATHNILNLSLLGCYFVTLTMFRYSFSDFEINNNRAKAVTLLSTLIVSVAIFTSAILIDYDWRYRYPLIAPLILLTTLIFDNFLNSRGEKKSDGKR